MCVCVRVDYYYITLSSIEWVHLNHFSWWDKIAVTSSSTQADVRRHRPVGWRLQQNLFPSGWREILRETIGNHYILRTKITIYIYYTPYIYACVWWYNLWFSDVPLKPSDLSVSELGASNFQFRYAIHVALASLRRSSVCLPMELQLCHNPNYSSSKFHGWELIIPIYIPHENRDFGDLQCAFDGPIFRDYTELMTAVAPFVFQACDKLDEFSSTQLPFGCSWVNDVDPRRLVIGVIKHLIRMATWIFQAFNTQNHQHHSTCSRSPKQLVPSLDAWTTSLDELIYVNWFQLMFWYVLQFHFFDSCTSFASSAGTHLPMSWSLSQGQLCFGQSPRPALTSGNLTARAGGVQYTF